MGEGVARGVGDDGSLGGATAGNVAPPAVGDGVSLGQTCGVPWQAASAAASPTHTMIRTAPQVQSLSDIVGAYSVPARPLWDGLSSRSVSAVRALAGWKACPTCL